MKIAIYTNKATNEVYKLVGINKIQNAWDLAEFVCNRMNWNIEAFTMDVNIKIQ